MGLTPEQIETINAHGPYASGPWRTEDVTISHEEVLAGRADFVAATVREAILRRFTIDQIRTMSIVDVGCYDGWFLEQGLDLPFARRVGIEPREKNIAKGHAVRGALGLPTVAEYLCRGWEDLPDEQFDIVLCTGLLHHVESPGPPLRALRAVAGRLLLLETLVLPTAHLTDALRADLELKDVVYRYSDTAFGVSGQKFESSYYDGSADVMTVVSISSVDTLRMHLAVAGFSDVEVIVSPDEFHAGDTRRRWAGTIMEAVPGDGLREQHWIADYEIGLARTALPLDVIGPLFELVGTDRLAAAVTELTIEGDEIVADIVATLRYNPDDKVTLEYGKAILAEEPDRAVTVLRGVTEKLNADWRSVYRAHHALARAYRLLGDEDRARRHDDLCRTCNARWPED